jgi:hypothetical protein
VLVYTTRNAAVARARCGQCRHDFQIVKHRRSNAPARGPAKSRRKLVCPIADVGPVDANWPFTVEFGLWMLAGIL